VKARDLVTIQPAGTGSPLALNTRTVAQAGARFSPGMAGCPGNGSTWKDVELMTMRIVLDESIVEIVGYVCLPPLTCIAAVTQVVPRWPHLRFAGVLHCAPLP
jgi:hypothetical protein